MPQKTKHTGWAAGLTLVPTLAATVGWSDPTHAESIVPALHATKP
jgi:hypothetical protein